MGCVFSCCRSIVQTQQVQTTGTNSQIKLYEQGQNRNLKLLSSKLDIMRSSNLISAIDEAIKTTKSDSNIFSHQFWTYALSKFKNLSMNKSEKLQFIDIIDEFFKVNFKIKEVESLQDFSLEFGQKLHLFQNRLYWKHKRCLEYLKLIGDPTKHKESVNLGFFSKLNFNMDFNETQKVAQKGRQLFQNDMDSIAFLTLYLQISIQNRLKSNSIIQVQKELIRQIVELQKIYPANDAQISIPKELTLKQIKIQSKHFQMVHFQKNQKNSEQLKSFILQKVQHAKNEQKVFQNLIKSLCYQSGYGFKCGLKIKNSSNISSIFRTIEKLMQKDEFKKNFENLINKFQKKYESDDGTFKNEIQNSLKYQTQQVQSLISELLECQQSILFDSKDLLRGKCIFTKVEDIINTANKLIDHIKKQGHEVIELKNRLNRHTKDVVLIIKLPKSIAEFQLALKLDSVANEFNHKLYELERSKTYTPIANLLIHNKKWSEFFFTEYLEVFKEVTSCEQQPRLQYRYNQKEFKNDLELFKMKSLDPNTIGTQKKQSQIIEQALKVQEKLKELKDFISNKNKSKFDKEGRKENQILNEIRFFLKNLDYQKGLQLLKNIPDSQLQKDESFLRIKGDILFEKGQTKLCLQYYLKAEQFIKIQNYQSLENAIFFDQIGKTYMMQGDYGKALQYGQKSLEIKTKINGKESIDAAVTIQNIGVVYTKKMDYEKALEHFQKCLKIKTLIKGNDSFDSAVTLNNIGVVYQNKGNYEKSLDYYQKSLDIKTKLKGNESIDAAATLKNIGNVYGFKKDADKALEYYQRSFDIEANIKGYDSIDASYALNNIGIAYKNKKEYQKALDCYQRCLQIMIKVKGRDSIDVAQILYNLSFLLQRIDKLQYALECAKQAYENRNKILGSQHQNTKAALEQVQLLQQYIREDREKQNQRF